MEYTLQQQILDLKAEIVHLEHFETGFWWLLAIFFVTFFGLNWLIGYKQKQKEDFRYKFLHANFEDEVKERELKILRNHNDPVLMIKNWEEIQEIKNLASEELKKLEELFISICSNSIILKFLIQDHVYDATSQLKPVLDIADEDQRSRIVSEITKETSEHFYKLFSEWMKNAEYDQVLVLHRDIAFEPKCSSERVDFEGICWFYRPIIFQKNLLFESVNFFDEFFVLKMKDLTQKDLIDLTDDNETFDAIFEIYQRNYIYEETESKAKERLIVYRSWAQENLTKPEHSEEAQRIIEELASANLLVDEPVVPVEEG